LTGATQYVGSVTWGWKINARGKAEKLPLGKVSQDSASNAFKAAAAHFNGLQVPATLAGGALSAVMQIPT
jgi:hypothetical protein